MLFHAANHIINPFHRHTETKRTPGKAIDIDGGKYLPIVLPSHRPPTEIEPGFPMPLIQLPNHEELLEVGKKATEFYPDSPTEIEVPNKKSHALYILG